MVLIIRAHEENDTLFTGVRNIGHLTFYSHFCCHRQSSDRPAPRPRKAEGTLSDRAWMLPSKHIHGSVGGIVNPTFRKSSDGARLHANRSLCQPCESQIPEWYASRRRGDARDRLLQTLTQQTTRSVPRDSQPQYDAGNQGKCPQCHDWSPHADFCCQVMHVMNRCNRRRNATRFRFKQRHASTSFAT
jgi:hypothetical protein